MKLARRALVLGALLASIVLAAWAQLAAPLAAHADGNWWQQASKAEQDGFYWGALACQEMLGIPQPLGVSPAGIESDIYVWYPLDRMQVPVLRAEQHVFAAYRRKKLYRFGRPRLEPTGYVWKMLPRERLDIAFGFLTCQSEQAHQPIKLTPLELTAGMNVYLGLANNDGGQHVEPRSVKLSAAILHVERGMARKQELK